MAGTVPIAGGLLLKIVRGGAEIGNLTLTRFFAIHTYILPWTIALLAGLHVLMLELAGPGGVWDTKLHTPDRNEPLFPNQIYKDSLFILAIFICLVVLAMAAPAALEPQADPTDTTYNPRPEWYFYFMFQLLRVFEGPFEAIGTVFLPALGGLLMVLLPFLDRSTDRAPARRKALMAIAGLVVCGVILLTILGALAPIVQAPAVTSPSVLAGRLLYETRTDAAHAIAFRARGARSAPT